MKLSDKGLKLIMGWEKFRPDAYLDEAGVPTIGWGHTGGVSVGDTITLERARELLIADVQDAEDDVNRLVEAPLSQHQFDALVSLAFNIGSQAFAQSTLVRVLNDADYSSAAEQILVWNKVNKKLSAGLVRRRFREKAYFEMGELMDV